jgi:chromosomal replication initiation ATPase DnaA
MIWTEQAIKADLDGTFRAIDQSGVPYSVEVSNDYMPTLKRMKAQAEARDEARQRYIHSQVLRKTETIKSALEDIRIKAIRRGYVHLSDIMEATAIVSGVAMVDLNSPRRKAPYARARQIYYYVARTVTPVSFPRIAQTVGKDHSTVMHGVEKVENDKASFEPELSRVLGLFRREVEAA